MQYAEMVETLHDWYATQRRQALPWRAAPGQLNDPYHVWLSEIMLQQTTVKAVIPYFLKFTQKWPTVKDLAAAPLADVLDAWAGLGYYARARNLHKCAQSVVRDYGGQFPDTYHALLKLPGIGPYTAAAISTIAFGKSAPVMDGNIERIVGRLFCIEDELPRAKPQYQAHVAAIFAHDIRHPGDVAQALMDIGATICTPANPACLQCPLRPMCCGGRAGTATTYPRKAAKPIIPEKHGHVFIYQDMQGRLAVQRRPESGMLGGMLGLPTSEWVMRDIALPHAGAVRGQVRHVFTHFALTLYIIQRPASEAPADAHWITITPEAHKNFPTLFRKVVRLLV